MSLFDFHAEPFQPIPLMTNAHVQTLVGKFLRARTPIDFRRVRLDTPDGDFIDLDFADAPGCTWQQLGEDAPIMLLLHGLEGSAKAGYAYILYQQAAKAGFRPLGMNFRSCSEEINRTPRLYHLGATDDVALVHDWLDAQYPNVAKVIVGFSLGGNLLLKHLGENADAMAKRLLAAAAVSPPFIATGRQALNHGLGALYGLFLIHRLQRKIRLKAYQLADAEVDVAAALKVKTLSAFDDVVTAPLHGFNDAQDYYGQCQSANFLADIQVPTLIIRAQDDPFFNRDIPYEAINLNPNLHGVFPRHGGHVGFSEGLRPHREGDWAQRQVIQFFREAYNGSLA